jgi:SAM-dependent methyltransferase
VSKAHDDSSRASKDDARGAKVAGDAKKVTVDGATPRRVRSAGPRERSGPIGITSGDFSTPLVRKRTTTQPRGVPVVGNQVVPAAPSLDEPVKAAIPDDAVDDDPITPPPEPAAEPVSEDTLQIAPPAAVGATPAAPVDAIPVAMPTRPAPPPVPSDDDPFSPGGPAPRVDIDAEAALLAAEAAAVRALDSGPLTPPPEVLSSAAPAAAPDLAETPTPPPEVKAPTPAPETTVTRTPPPDVVAAARTPLPEPMAAPLTPAPEAVVAPRPPLPDSADATLTPPPTMVSSVKAASEITVTRTPSPELVAATRTPPPEIGAVLTPPPHLSDDYSSPIAAAAAAAASAVEPLTPPPELQAPPAEEAGSNGAGLAPGAEGAPLPTLEMQANVGLATLPAVALSDAEGEVPGHDSAGATPSEEALDAEVDGDEHVEMMDGSEEGVDVSPTTQAQALRGPALKAAPPPIPGRHLRTPGPELIAPPPPVVAAVAVVPPIIPEALAQRPRRPKRSKPWFEEVFDEDYLRTLPFMRADQTLREVEFVADALRVGAGAEILDVACGYGRHAFELVQRGYNVTGLDLSLPLLLRAAEESKRLSLPVKFVHGDMREMEFEQQFDGAYSMLTSFGYFDEDTNLRVAERIGRALKPGARFLLDIVNRDYVVSDLPVRVWWEGTGCVVLEEVDFNFHTSRIVTHRSIVFEDGRQLEQEMSVRAYSLHEIGRLLRQAGFRVIDVSGGLNTRGQFFGNVSRSLLIVAEKREADSAQPL